MRAEYFMIGGFLGAGKTTSMLALARHLTNQGRRVGLITNDQSQGLADTALAAAHAFPVAEITGGCFCCRFGSLIGATERLAAESAPDVLIAEPVGSCTDLRATVQYPLRKLYGERFRIGPLTVLMDPARALRVLGLEAGRAFSPRVQYVYSKQLEEADILVINKSDTVEPDKLDRLTKELRARWSRALVLRMSALRETGLETWCDALAGTGWHGASPDVDYDRYAEGEALLGWINATARLTGAASTNGDTILLELAERVRSRLEGIEIAHLKITLAPAEGGLGVVNLTSGPPEVSRSLASSVTAGELLLNLRAEAPPELLRDAVVHALAGAELTRCEMTRCDSFRPARPVPTHRMEDCP